LEYILLCPKTKLVHHPVAPIIKRQKDIVDVYDHAWFEARQDFQEKIIHVSADLYGMRTIDEQNIARIKLREKSYVDVFHLLLYQGM
jgi:hypothetical protein